MHINFCKQTLSDRRPALCILLVQGRACGELSAGGGQKQEPRQGQWEARSLLGGLPERSPNGSTSRETTSCHPSLHQAGANQTERQVNF